MSSFIVDKETIVRIVDAVFWFNKFKPSYALGLPQFLKTKKEIATELMKMNHDAVSFLYKKHDFPAITTFRESDFSDGATPDLLQVHKSISCLLYQCSEGDIPEKNNMYKWLNSFKGSVAFYLIATQVRIGGQTYEDKKWG